MDKLVEMLAEMDSNHQRTLIFVETKKLADVVAGRLSDEEKMSATSVSASVLTMKLFPVFLLLKIISGKII